MAPKLDPDIKIEEALKLIFQYGGIDGNHHKQWVLDQVVRTLTGSEEEYQAWVKLYQEADENNDPQYMWDEGIAP